MKRIIKICLVLLLLIFTGSGIAKAENSNVAVINTEDVLNNSLAVIDFKNQLNQEKETLEKKFADKEKDLAKQKETLEKKAALLSQEQLQVEIAKFKQDVEKAQEEANNAESKMQTKTLEGLEKIKNEIVLILEEMSKEENFSKYDVVINSNALLFSKNENDLTKEVLKRLNKKYKTYSDLNKEKKVEKK